MPTMTSQTPANIDTVIDRRSSGKPKIWACRRCKTRKIKCDGVQPVCSTCIAHGRQCEFDAEGPRRRSRIPGSRRAERERLKAPQEEIQIAAGQEAQFNVHKDFSSTPSRTGLGYMMDLGVRSSELSQRDILTEVEITKQDAVDVRDHLSVDGSGNIEARGPTNTLYESNNRHDVVHPENPEPWASAMLTSNAALERQKELGYKETLLNRGHIEGVPAELALHLLDIHWSRHHFFLITYRPPFYRDMMNGGPYYSPLLLFAILAVSSRYSERPEVGGGDHSVQSGIDFYKKAKELLVEDMDKSTIPTATALLLMGNALVSAGQIDRGWLYTGMGIRMVMNMGLHIDSNRSAATATSQKTLEVNEIRKRLFWGAFVCEKLQSLYLGQPFFIHESDIHVPKTFLDVYEEGEIWAPVPDHCTRKLGIMTTNSVSNFTNQCILAEICGDIISSFYAVKAKMKSRTWLHSARDDIRRRLSTWIENLPEALKFTPWEANQKNVPIHVIVLHTVYFSLVIVLERPFVADGHLMSSDDNMGSWVECTIAAEKIVYLLYWYRKSYTFRRIPYQLCYTTYVASTILVRNANNSQGISPAIKHLAVCLKAFEEMKLAHPGSSRMESIIRSLMTRLGVNVDDQFLESHSSASPSFDNLPNPDFDTTNLAAFASRHLDIETIRQSFTQGSAHQQHLPTNPETGLNGFNTHPNNLPPSGTFFDPSIPQNDEFSDFNWNFAGEDPGNDLLFGVLRDDWM